MVHQRPSYRVNMIPHVDSLPLCDLPVSLMERAHTSSIIQQRIVDRPSGNYLLSGQIIEIEPRIKVSKFHNPKASALHENW